MDTRVDTGLLGLLMGAIDALCFFFFPPHALCFSTPSSGYEDGGAQGLSLHLRCKCAGCAMVECGESMLECHPG